MTAALGARSVRLCLRVTRVTCQTSPSVSYPVLISSLRHSAVSILSWCFLWFPWLEPQAALSWKDWPMDPSASDTTCSIPWAAECLGSQDTWLLGLALPLAAWLRANHITSLGLSVHTWEMKGLHHISDSLLWSFFFSLPNTASDTDLPIRHTSIGQFWVLTNSIPFFPTQESLSECKGRTEKVCFY